MAHVQPVPMSGASRATPSSVLLPLFGLLVAAGLIISRRPDTVIHARFWAEDGHLYYANVYNLGIKQALILPQAGYFETVPVLVAWVARFFPLTDAPFVTTLFGLLIQALPVALLLSPRAETIHEDVRVRAVISLAYLVLPYGNELDATAVNAQWSLAVAAVVVLAMKPPRRPGWRVLDAAILLATGLTGPFAFVLAPLAWYRRRRQGDAFVPRWMALMLTACFVLQLLSVTVIAHAGPNVESRPDPQLMASPALFAQLVGGRVFLGAIIGEGHGLSATLAEQWVALGIGAIVVLAAFSFGREELKMLTVVAAFVLVGTLLNPSVPTPAWPLLAAVPPNSPRYFFLEDLAIVALLVSVAASPGVLAVRAAAGALVVAALAFAVAGHWTYPALPPTDFSAKAAYFDRAPKGTTVSLNLNPPSWTMTLLKR